MPLVEDRAQRDPLLLVHRLPHGEYSIAGKYNPVSIKDQMVRAISIVDRAIFHRVLQPGQRLLIVGAGAAGASAALRAAAHGIDTTVVERASEPFTRQRGSDRTVDPTEYDWPAPHWEEGKLKALLPLALLRLPAGDLASRWASEFKLQRAHLQILYNCNYLGSIRHEGSKTGQLIALTGPWPEQAKFSTEKLAVFDMILNCSGPGVESVTMGSFASFGFWENDWLASDGFGLAPRSKRAPPPRILLSGGGDGSLQDFLRIAFPGRTPTGIYKKFVPRRLHREIERSIFSAEDAFRRAWIWTEEPTLDHVVLRRLHDAHVEVANRAFAEGAVLVPDGDLRRLKNVRIVHPCSHFSVCYAFNHFLALLLNLSLGGKQLISGQRLAAVESAAPAHVCEKRASHCWQHPHKVTFERAQCGKPSEPLPVSGIFDLVLLRHGPVVGTPALARQILPYDLPW